MSLVLNAVVNGRRGEIPERNSSISETDWVHGRRSVDSSKKVPCPVKKQNLKGKCERMNTMGKKNQRETRTC